MKVDDDNPKRVLPIASNGKNLIQAVVIAYSYPIDLLFII